jgi:hypothetical protein
MNIPLKKLRNLLSDSKFVVPLMCFLGSILICFIFYIFGTRTHYANMRHLQNDVAATAKKLERYKRFDFASPELHGQQEKIDKIATNLGISSGSSGMSADPLAYIGGISKELNVRIGQIVASKGDKGQVWTVSFEADFAKIDNFLSRIEQAYRIENLVINRDEGNRGPQVVVIISNFIAQETQGTVSTGPSKDHPDFLDLFDKTTGIIARIERSANEKQNTAGVAADPFRSARPGEATTVKTAVKKPQPVGKPEPKEPGGPNFNLEAIFWDATTPAAIIDGRAIKEGDSTGEAQVVKINEQDVVIKWHSQSITVKLKGK